MSFGIELNETGHANGETHPSWKKLKRGCLGIAGILATGFVLLLVIGLIVGPKSSNRSNEGAAKAGTATPSPIASAANKALEAVNEKISPDAVAPMDRENFPRFYQTLGRARFDEANALAIWVARATAASESCERVSYVGQSDATTRSRLVWYVDCSNDERFTITEDDARAAKGRLDPQATDAEKRLADRPVARPQSARWENFDEAVAISQCDQIVSTVAINRGSVDFAWRWDTELNADTGVVTFQRDFDAQNAVGGTISSRYHCEVDADRGRVTKLMIRELDGWRTLIGR
jgi:hypothetical protein